MKLNSTIKFNIFVPTGKFYFANIQFDRFGSFSKRSVRIDYIVKNLSVPRSIPSSNSIFGKFMNDCISHQAHSIYLIEPRSSNKDIYDELGKAWRQSNGENVNISSEFFLDSSYLTNKKLVKNFLFSFF